MDLPAVQRRVILGAVIMSHHTSEEMEILVQPIPVSPLMKTVMEVYLIKQCPLDFASSNFKNSFLRIVEFRCASCEIIEAQIRSKGR